MHGAAFFDLDRTLLAGASGEVFGKALRAAGVVSRQIPGESVLYGVFNTIGETLPSMVLARQAALLARGVARDAVREAATQVAPELVARVQPGAAAVFAEHRAAGRPIVLATTTPADLVTPFAELLGVDDVVATRYRVGADGTYDGSLDGPFVWSLGKLAAVRSWADARGISLRASYAYSDSVYDLPLLGAVGHPFAVNPDPRLLVVATARRWPRLDLGARRGADDAPGAPAPPDRSAPPAPSDASRPGDGGGPLRLPVVDVDVQRLLLRLVHPLAFPYASFDIAGDERIPREGPVIVVANHRSYFDVVAMAVLLARVGRTVRFLGKREVFDAPVIGQLARAMGGIPVDRGSGSDAPLRAAEAALERGDLVAMMPQGTIPRGEAFFDPVLQGRTGAARLAAATRAPVVPVGLWGTERVWPRSSRVPDVLGVVDPPKVTVRVGAPVRLLHRSMPADTRRIMTAIMDLLPPESRERHEPSADELARTMPPS